MVAVIVTFSVQWCLCCSPDMTTILQKTVENGVNGEKRKLRHGRDITTILLAWCY